MIDGNTNDLSLNELSGGARISFVFHELFNNGVRGIDPFDQVKDGDIRTILYNSSVSLPWCIILASWTSDLQMRCHCLLFPLLGFDPFALCRHYRVRSHRQTADPKIGRAVSAMLSARLRRIDQDSGSALGQDSEWRRLSLIEATPVECLLIACRSRLSSDTRSCEIGSTRSSSTFSKSRWCRPTSWSRTWSRESLTNVRLVRSTT